MAKPLTQAEFATRAATLAIDVATVHVVNSLRARGVRSIVLRGPALAQWLYPDSFRSYVDVDLLVPPEQLPRAGEALSGMGFAERSAELRPHERETHSSEWSGSRPRVMIDLHRTLIGAGIEPRVLWRTLASRARTLLLPGGEVEIPDDEALALIVALHAAQHGADAGKPLMDLGRAVRGRDAHVWRGAAALAAELDAMPALATGLRMLPNGRAVASELALPNAVDPLTLLRAGARRPTAFGFAALAEAPGIRAKTALIVRKAIPSQAFLRQTFPMTRHGRLGLAAAYAWRPLSLLLHAPSGIRAWRRAVRQSALSPRPTPSQPDRRVDAVLDPAARS